VASKCPTVPLLFSASLGSKRLSSRHLKIHRKALHPKKLCLHLLLCLRLTVSRQLSTCNVSITISKLTRLSKLALLSAGYCARLSAGYCSSRRSFCCTPEKNRRRSVPVSLSLEAQQAMSGAAEPSPLLLASHQGIAPLGVPSVAPAGARPKKSQACCSCSSES